MEPNLPPASWLGLGLAVVQLVQAVALAWIRRQQVVHRRQCSPPSRRTPSGVALAKCLCSVCSAIGEKCWHEVSPSEDASHSPRA
jgi:hypothetical protein